eukprot:Skav235133  [mRNA]  locus=scaffold321:292321:302055:- [translate_table: standard]
MDRQSFFRPADDMDLMDPLSDFEDDKAISPPSGFAARSMALAAKKRGLGMGASSTVFDKWSWSTTATDARDSFSSKSAEDLLTDDEDFEARHLQQNQHIDKLSRKNSTMGVMSADARTFTKKYNKGRAEAEAPLSIVSENKVHFQGGTVRYALQFTEGELCSADGVGFILSADLPCTRILGAEPATVSFKEVLENARGRVPVPRNPCGFLAVVIKHVGVSVQLGS